MSETDYPQMEKQPTVYLEDTGTYKCTNCGRYISVPDDQARPTTCPYGCQSANKNA
jgi:hypothetical protein